MFHNMGKLPLVEYIECRIPLMVLVPKSRASAGAVQSVSIGLLSANVNTDAFDCGVLLSRLSMGDDVLQRVLLASSD